MPRVQLLISDMDGITQDAIHLERFDQAAVLDYLNQEVWNDPAENPNVREWQEGSRQIIQVDARHHGLYQFSCRKPATKSK